MQTCIQTACDSNGHSLAKLVLELIIVLVLYPATRRRFRYGYPFLPSIPLFEIDSWEWGDFFPLYDQVNDLILRLEEPIHLLKMTCPSTGNIYVIRVPPNIRSARQAIRWINWGTDPKQFTVQT